MKIKKDIIQIQNGLFDHMVVQRYSSGYGRISFSGCCAGNNAGDLCLRAKNGSWLVIGRVSGGAWRGLIRRIPVGGPYAFEIGIRDKMRRMVATTQIKDVYVGDVWVLAGQSNMVGDGLLAESEKALPSVRCFYMDDTWGPAKDPLHCSAAAFDRIHHVLAGRDGPVGARKKIDRGRCRGTGCGISFANEMTRTLDIPIGLIACAHGGTSLTQWLPSKQSVVSDSLYGALLRRVRKNGGAVTGILWYQGEADTNYADAVHFKSRMKRLISNLRRDLNAPCLPFVQAQLARLHTTETGFKEYLWMFVREQQRQLGLELKRTAAVGTLDLVMKDSVHVNASGLVRLGHRMAKAALALVKNKKTSMHPVCPNIFSAAFKRGHDGVFVEAMFEGVNGRLTALGEPVGFRIIGEYGWELSVFNTKLQDNKAQIFFCDDNPRRERFFLYYGYGTHSVCNIIDAEDCALLGFGPFPIGVKPPYPE